MLLCDKEGESKNTHTKTERENIERIEKTLRNVSFSRV